MQNDTVKLIYEKQELLSTMSVVWQTTLKRQRRTQNIFRLPPHNALKMSVGVPYKECVVGWDSALRGVFWISCLESMGVRERCR